MTRSQKLYNQLFILIAGTIFAFSLSTTLISLTYMEISWSQQFFACFAIILALLLIFYNKYTMLITSGIIAICIAIIMFNTFSGSGAFFDSLGEYASRLTYHIQGLIPYESGFWLLSLLLISFICVITVLNTRVRFNYVFLAIGGSVCFIAPLFIGFKVSAISIAMYSLAVVLFLVKRLFPADSVNVRSIASIICVCLAGFGLAALVPKPVQSSTADISASQKLSQLSYSLSEAVRPKYFTFTSTGFTGSSGLLGGPVTINNDYVMTVTSKNRIRLAGAYKDVYTGSAWTKSESVIQEIFDDNGEYSLVYDDLYSAFPYMEEWLKLAQDNSRSITNGLAEVTTVKVINPRTTRTVFVPNMAQTIRISSDDGIRMDYYGALTSKSILSSTDAYEFKVISLSDEFIEQLVYNYLLTENSESTSAENAYTSANAEKYLTVSATIPQRVYELSLDVAGDGSDYEKIRNLTDYLLRYPYTLEPEVIPEGVDFVDYFLFEGQEGYCTYFASALAVMGRIVGVPTRYVEGFSMPTERNSNGDFAVTNQNAHAWVEAWISGIGWVEFEATPPYYRDAVTTGDSSLFDDFLPDPNEYPNPNNPNELDVPEPTPQQPTPGTTETSPDPEGADDGGSVPALWRVLLPLGLLLIAAAILLLRKRRKTTNNQVVIKAYRRILRLSGSDDAESNDKLFSKAAIAEKSLHEKGEDIAILPVARIYAKALYGKGRISNAEKNQVLDTVDRVKALWRRTFFRKGIIKKILG